jgi:hypothetical protein
VNLEIHLDGRHNPVCVAFLLDFVRRKRPDELTDGLAIPGEIQLHDRRPSREIRTLGDL